MNALENYKVKFLRKGETQFKSMSSKNSMLSAYVTSYLSLISLKVLVTACDYSISGGEEITNMETDDMYMAEIGPSSTKIYQDMDVWGAGGVEPDFELPTTDFKEIVVAWKNFFEG